MNTYRIFTAKFNNFSEKYIGYEKNSVLNVPQQYYLLKTLKNFSREDGSFVGIFRNKSDKLALIKQYISRFKTRSYYHIRNEAFILNLLSGWIYKSNTVQISFPKLYKSIESKHTFTLVSEYIDGLPLTKFPNTQIQETLKNVLFSLRVLSLNLSDTKKRNIPRRHFGMLMITFPYLILRVLIREKSHFYLYLLYQFYKYMFLAFRGKINYVLAHRDLYPRNIQLKGKKIVILDPEMMVYSAEGTDLAIVLPYYINKLGKNKVAELISEFSTTSQKRHLLAALTIFYSIHTLAVEPLAHADYNRVLKFLSSYKKWEVLFFKSGLNDVTLRHTHLNIIG